MKADLEIVAPTALEWWAVRCKARGARVTRSGVALKRWPGEMAEARIVTCGLAGSLVRGVPSGTVIIPATVGLPNGARFACDDDLVSALVRGARALGFEPVTGPMLTASALITGSEREPWAVRGFVAADMETALLAERGLRVASVRVALDSPDRSIDAGWERASRAFWRPSLLMELVWLSRYAPRYALRAAAVLNAGLAHLSPED